MRRKTGIIILIIILLILLIYASNITSIPNNIILFQGEELKLFTVLGLSINNINSSVINLQNYETMQTSANMTKEVISSNIGKVEIALNLFDKIPIKRINVNIIPKTTVVPVRKCYRIKIIYRWCISCRNVRNRRIRF